MRDGIIDTVTADAGATQGGGGNVLDEIVGPFWDANGVTAHLKLRRGDLAEKVATDQIIWAPLAGGTPVFPAWQFHTDPDVRDRLLTVWQALRAAADPWTAGVWMCSPARDLDGQSVIAYLVDGDPLDPRRLATVMALVADDTARWRQ